MNIICVCIDIDKTNVTKVLPLEGWSVVAAAAAAETGQSAHAQLVRVGGNGQRRDAENGRVVLVGDVVSARLVLRRDQLRLAASAKPKLGLVREKATRAFYLRHVWAPFEAFVVVVDNTTQIRTFNFLHTVMQTRNLISLLYGYYLALSKYIWVYDPHFGMSYTISIQSYLSLSLI